MPPGPERSPIPQLSAPQAEVLALGGRHRHRLPGLERVDEQLRHDAHTNKFFRLPQIFVPETEAQESGSAKEDSGLLILDQRVDEEFSQVRHFGTGKTLDPQASECNVH